MTICNTTTTFPFETGNGWINAKAVNERYNFLDASYSGQGGYANGSYLIPHRREDSIAFSVRKAKSRIINDFKAIVDGWVAPIFRVCPTISLNENLTQTQEDAYEMFMKNCDGNGTSYRQFLKKMARASRKYDSVFVLVDNAPIANIMTADQLQNRDNLPYLVLITPDKVNTISCDEQGRIVEFSWITYAPVESFNVASDLTSMTLNNDYIINVQNKRITTTYYTNYWVKTVDGVIIEQGDNGLGYIPVVPVYPDGNDDYVIDPLPYGLGFTLASIQLRRFNLASIIDEISDSQAFSILIIPGQHQDITVGSNNALVGTSEQGNEPKYISPDANQLTTLQKLMDGMTEEMYRTGVMTHLRTFAQSAESKRLDSERTQEVLGDFQQQIKEADEKIMKIFGDYLGVDYEYDAEYAQRFGLENLDQVLLVFNTLDKATNQAPLEIYGKLVEKMIESVLGHSDDMEVYSEIIETHYDPMQIEDKVEIASGEEPDAEEIVIDEIIKEENVNN